MFGRIKVMTTMLLFAILSFTPALGILEWAPKVLSSTDSSCDSIYSCADIHTAKVCRPMSGGQLESFRTVRCPLSRPYCDPKSGTCISNGLIRSTQAREDNSCGAVFSCWDCNTAQICRPTNNGTLVFYRYLPCPEDRPFCDVSSGSCISEESVNCGISGQIGCVHDGKFPDTDCNSFHYCVGSQSTTLQCAPKEHYNPTTGGCDDKTPCALFPCRDNVARKVPHPLDHRFFAFCGPNGPISVDACPQSYVLNVTSQRCEATCHYVGLVLDVEDCHSYYKCTKIFINATRSYFLKERKRCPEGESFDSDRFICDADNSNLPQCTVLKV